MGSFGVWRTLLCREELDVENYERMSTCGFMRSFNSSGPVEDEWILYTCITIMKKKMAFPGSLAIVLCG